ncbi:hypothetical protein ENC_35570 [Enterobacter hormaechei]|nr:hypothetical protein ENC_35570 [Enterobacter hormaechei]
MWLRKVKNKNFRGDRNTTEIINDDVMTGIVCPNDLGKSTLPEAMAIFFEAEGINSEKNKAGAYIAPHNTGSEDKI